jgi:hypothetical protein
MTRIVIPYSIPLLSGKNIFDFVFTLGINAFRGVIVEWELDINYGSKMPDPLPRSAGEG